MEATEDKNIQDSYTGRSTSPLSPFDGVRWVRREEDHAVRPLWPREPNLECIKSLIRQHFNLTEDEGFELEEIGKGSSNTSFVVKLATKDAFILRIALPIISKLKTESEVATINYIRSHTSMTVPSIMHFDSSRSNVTGFEYIMMTKGAKPLYHIWFTLDMAQRKAIVQALASYQAQLFRCKLEGIGSLHAVTDPDKRFVVSSMVAKHLYWGATAPVRSYGPYTNAYEWISDCLGACERYTKERLALALRYMQDEESTTTFKTQLTEWQEELNTILDDLLPGFRTILPVLFDANAKAEPTYLFHNDLHMANILWDNDGAGSLQSPMLIDWEYTLVAPAWYACQLPKFLENPAGPPLVAGESDTDRRERVHEELAAIEELTTVYIDTMRELEPEWVENYESGQVHRGFIDIVHHCFSDGCLYTAEAIVLAANRHLEYHKQNNTTPDLYERLHRMLNPFSQLEMAMASVSLHQRKH